MIRFLADFYSFYFLTCREILHNKFFALFYSVSCKTPLERINYLLASDDTEKIGADKALSFVSSTTQVPSLNYLFKHNLSSSIDTNAAMPRFRPSFHDVQK